MEYGTKKRKGVVNKDVYKRNVIKKAKIYGLPHVNHRGKEVAARETGLPCKYVCFSFEVI